MRQISQLIAVNLDKEGHRTKYTSEENLASLYERLWAEFRDSDIGQKLIARGGPDIMDRVLEIYGQRSTVRHPGVYPVFEHLEEIGNDLLITLPEPVAPAAPVPVEPVNLTPAKPVPTASKEVTFFAHAYNHQLLTKGCDSLRINGGFMTLEVQGTRYAYPAVEADKLLNEAISFRLIR